MEGDAKGRNCNRLHQSEARRTLFLLFSNYFHSQRSQFTNELLNNPVNNKLICLLLTLVSGPVIYCVSRDEALIFKPSNAGARQ